ncbi:MAG: hypothetical protein AB7E05_08895 [Sphingobium sp.]
MAILRQIERFLRDTGMAPTRFGRDAVRDPRLVLDMRNGREPSPRMVRRLEHFMSVFQ